MQGHTHGLPGCGMNELFPLHIFGPNDGGIRRGDRTETGDEEAQPNILNDELPFPEDDQMDNFEEMPGPDSDDMQVVSPFNPRSGVTNTSRRSKDDWAADTGPAQTPESIRDE